MRTQKWQKPQASRLKLPEGYQQADGQVELLLWSSVAEQLEQAQNYWLATLSPRQQPHVTPVWGVWVEGALYFDGIPTARWARNIAANPAIAVHLESGIQVVILEGLAEDVVTDAAVSEAVIKSWNAKYGRLLPEPDTEGIFRLQPRTARAWSSQFPHDATRWQFA
jgi:nitroimidazol reductase NimA-like FMN-containing flavoprotein (pyridoxamine 5'-phosphate oxidase superfamily)